MKHTDLDFKFKANDVRCWYRRGNLLLNFCDVQNPLLQNHKNEPGCSTMKLMPHHEEYVSVYYFWLMCHHVKDEEFFRDVILSVIDALAKSIVMEVAK